MTSTDIYDQHDKAFNQVSAFVIMRDGLKIGTVAFKFPKDGPGRLYCYLHIYSYPMVRGFAGGYGYDKRSAAVASAADKILSVPDDAGDAHQIAHLLTPDGGHDWTWNLNQAGYRALQAV